MKIVIDTNIVFSAILNANGKIGQLILFSENLTFYAPSLIKTELRKHKSKLLEISEMSEANFEEIKDTVFEFITLVSEEQIPFEYWKNALPLVRDVDMDDIAFVALSEYIDAQLWTGDKKLLHGILERGFQRGISTQQLTILLESNNF